MLKIRVHNLIFSVVLIGIIVGGLLPQSYEGLPDVLSLIISTFILFFVKSGSLFSRQYPFKQVVIFFIFLIFFITSTYITGQYKPLFFMLFVFVLFYDESPQSDILKIDFKFFLIFLFSLSALLAVFHSKALLVDQMRFAGFSMSPTVFAVTIQAVMILGLLVFKTKRHRILIIICAFIFVLLSRTRTNLILFLFIPFIPFLDKRSNSFRMFILVMFSLFIILVYPLYDLFIQTDIFASSGMFESRLEDGRDASFGLRYHFFSIGVNIISESSVFQFLFGHGAEYSRLAVIEEFDMDLKIHNDFIVLLIDYGLVFTIFFLSKLVQIGSRNPYAFLAVVLYLISFYHNMVLSLLLLLTIYYASSAVGERVDERDATYT